MYEIPGHQPAPGHDQEPVCNPDRLGEEELREEEHKADGQGDTAPPGKDPRSFHGYRKEDCTGSKTKEAGQEEPHTRAEPDGLCECQKEVDVARGPGFLP